VADPRASGEHPSRKEQEPADERQHAPDGDADDAKRQEYQPGDGIKHERKQRDRPTDDQENQPEKEGSHDH
jgi:hypothetical protein